MENFFDKLRSHYDQDVVLHLVAENSAFLYITGKLKHVIDHKCVVVRISQEELLRHDFYKKSAGLYSIPFIGNCEGIRAIADLKGQVLWSNPHITYTKNTHINHAEKIKEVNSIREQSFGSNAWNLTVENDDFYIEEIPFSNVMRLYNIARRGYVSRK